LLEVEKPNIAEQLQLERLLEKIQSQKIPRVLPAQLWMYGLLFLACLGLRYGLPLLKNEKQVNNNQQDSKVQMVQNQETAPSFASAQLTITPPPYTKLPVRVVSDLNVSSSMVHALNGNWNLVIRPN
jgi:hypothetical protein